MTVITGTLTNSTPEDKRASGWVPLVDKDGRDIGTAAVDGSRVTGHVTDTGVARWLEHVTRDAETRGRAAPFSLGWWAPGDARVVLDAIPAVPRRRWRDAIAEISADDPAHLISALQVTAPDVSALLAEVAADDQRWPGPPWQPQIGRASKRFDGVWHAGDGPCFEVVGLPAGPMAQKDEHRLEFGGYIARLRAREPQLVAALRSALRDLEAERAQHRADNDGAASALATSEHERQTAEDALAAARAEIPHPFDGSAPAIWGRKCRVCGMLPGADRHRVGVPAEPIIARGPTAEQLADPEVNSAMAAVRDAAAQPLRVESGSMRRIAELEVALRGLVDRVRRVAGYASPDEQTVLRAAESALAGAGDSPLSLLAATASRWAAAAAADRQAAVGFLDSDRTDHARYHLAGDRAERQNAAARAALDELLAAARALAPTSAEARDSQVQRVRDASAAAASSAPVPGAGDQGPGEQLDAIVAVFRAQGIKAARWVERGTGPQLDLQVGTEPELQQLADAIGGSRRAPSVIFGVTRHEHDGQLGGVSVRVWRAEASDEAAPLKRGARSQRELMPDRFAVVGELAAVSATGLIPWSAPSSAAGRAVEDPSTGHRDDPTLASLREVLVSAPADRLLETLRVVMLDLVGLLIQRDKPDPRIGKLCRPYQVNDRIARVVAVEPDGMLRVRDPAWSDDAEDWRVPESDVRWLDADVSAAPRNGGDL